MANILHIIPRMVQGGAERLLLDYLNSQETKHNHEVLTLFSDSDLKMAAPIAEKLQMRASRSYLNIAYDILPIRKKIVKDKPDAVVAWMYHAAVLAPLLVSRDIPILAYLHNTDLSEEAKWAERMAQKRLASMAHSARVSLLYSGEASRRFHEVALGYPSERAHVLANGIPLENFTADSARRQVARHEFGLSPEHFVFGSFGRFNPQKNWPLVLDAFAAAQRANSAVRLLAAGRGVSMANPDFAALVTARGLGEAVIALDTFSDMPKLYDALDVSLLGSAYGETYSLVLLEALAMGKPTIVTALGSIPDVVEGLWDAIPVDEPERFIATVEAAARGSWSGLAVPVDAMRERAVDRYGADAYARGFDAVLHMLT